MIKFLSSLAAILIFSGGVFAQEWAWKSFSPSGKSWTILAPGVMKPDEEALAPQSKMGSYRYSDFYGFFAVVYRDASKGFLISLPPDQKRHFKKVKADFIKASKGELLSEQDFTKDKIEGREVLIKIPSGTMTGVEGQVIQKYRIERIRMFFIGRRFYMLLAVLPENLVNTPNVDKFFNSFSFNSAPEALPDTYSVDEDQTLKIEPTRGILVNDRDEDGDNLTVAAARAETLPVNGSLTLNADGSFTYTPKANFFGQDSFSYKANDGQVDSGVVTVAITVNSVNDAPTISNLPPPATLDELTQMSFAALAGDIDTPADALRFTLIDAPAGATIDAVSGAFRWTPTEAQGPANHTFRVSVFDGSASAVGSVSVKVNEVNVAPQLANIANQTVDEETALNFNARATDADLPANSIVYSLVNAPTGMTINSTTGAVSWTPTEAQGAGTFTVTIRAADNGAPVLSAEQTVTITVREVNKAPISNAAEIDGVEDRTVSFVLRASDADLPANTLTYSIVTPPSNGNLNGSGANLSYTPKLDFNGTDSFTFKVNDGAADSQTATITIKVAPVNDAPVANSDNSATTVNVPVAIDVIGNDADVDRDMIVITGISNIIGGAAEIVSGMVKFTPNQNFRGTGTFRYTISDGKGGTADGLVTVTINAP